jgi:hypothetical protein
MAKVIWYEPVIKEVLYAKSGMVGRFVKKRGGIIQTLARTQVGGNTGALRASIHMRHATDPRGHLMRVGSDLDYAMSHHEGTSPRLIKPDRPNGVLRFATRGQIVFAHLVRHPGTRPNRYLTDSMRKALADTFR